MKIVKQYWFWATLFMLSLIVSYISIGFVIEKETYAWLFEIKVEEVFWYRLGFVIFSPFLIFLLLLVVIVDENASELRLDIKECKKQGKSKSYQDDSDSSERNIVSEITYMQSRLSGDDKLTAENKSSIFGKMF